MYLLVHECMYLLVWLFVQYAIPLCVLVLLFTVSRLDCAGYSWRKEDPAHEFYHHCFLVSRLKNGTSASSTSFNSGVCSREKDRRTTISALGQNGTYTGHLFSDAAVQVILC